MGLETATFVDDLVVTNPLGTDTIPQGDDHLRLLKTVLRNTFKGASRAFYLPATTSSQTSTVTVATTDQNKLIPVDCSGGAITVNLPQGSTLPDGFEVEIIKTDHSTNLLTIDGYSSETVNGLTTQTLWQSYQTAKLRYSSALSAWLMKREYMPPKGEVTPWVGASAICEGGWLFLNGQTIGDASSSGSARANADCLGLFTLLWTEFSNTVCPVSTGRGVSAAADWAAHKNIGLPNLCGDTWVGLDNMGGASDAGRLSASYAGTTGQTNGEQIGSESNTLTTAKLPLFTPTGTVAISPNPHHHSSGGTNTTKTVQSGVGASVVDNSGVPDTGDTSLTATFTGTQIGGGEAHANVQPSFVSGWKIKL